MTNEEGATISRIIQRKIDTAMAESARVDEAGRESIRVEVMALESLAHDLKRAFPGRFDGERLLSSPVSIPVYDGDSLNGITEEDKALDAARDSLRPDLQYQEWLRENA